MSGPLPTVCLDVDGCFADFYAAVRDALSQVDVGARPDGWRDPSANARILETETARVYEEMGAMLEAWLWPRVYASPSWWERVPLLRQVAAYRAHVRQLIMRVKMRADVVWVTSRRSAAFPASTQTERWLRKTRLDDSPNVVACAEGTLQKIQVLRALRPVALYEDHPEILSALALAGPFTYEDEAVRLRIAPPWPYCAGIPGVVNLPAVEALSTILLELARRGRNLGGNSEVRLS